LRCAVAVAPVRAEPREDAEQVTQALAGEPLDLEGRDGEWAFVRTAYGYPGWVRAESIEEGEGALAVDAEGTPVDVARSYLGARYLWGGMTNAGIDCSGLVHMAFRRLGHLVPRDAHQQERAGEPVDDPEPGDLVTYGEREADHIAFWLGDGRILHSTGGIGVVEELEPASLRARRRRCVRFAASAPIG
jgi:gamma-D-glutamyl-L-lysine dipeptidyl-peptidase